MWTSWFVVGNASNFLVSVRAMTACYQAGRAVFRLFADGLEIRAQAGGDLFQAGQTGAFHNLAGLAFGEFPEHWRP